MRAEKVNPLCADPTDKISGDLMFPSTCSGDKAKRWEEPESLRGHLSFHTLCSNPLFFV